MATSRLAGGLTVCVARLLRAAAVASLVAVVASAHAGELSLDALLKRDTIYISDLRGKGRSWSRLLRLDQQFDSSTFLFPTGHRHNTWLRAYRPDCYWGSERREPWHHRLAQGESGARFWRGTQSDLWASLNVDSRHLTIVGGGREA